MKFRKVKRISAKKNKIENKSLLIKTASKTKHQKNTVAHLTTQKSKDGKPLQKQKTVGINEGATCRRKKEIDSAISKEGKHSRVKNELPLKKCTQKNKTELPLKSQETIMTNKGGENRDEKKFHSTVSKARKQFRLKNEMPMIKCDMKIERKRQLKNEKRVAANRSPTNEGKNGKDLKSPKAKNQDISMVKTTQKSKDGKPMKKQKTVGIKEGATCRRKKETDPAIPKERKQSRVKNELSLKKRGPKTENEQPIKKEKTVGTKRSASKQNKNEVNLKCTKKRKQDKLKNKCSLIKTTQKSKDGKPLQKQKTVGKKETDPAIPKERKQSRVKNELSLQKTAQKNKTGQPLKNQKMVKTNKAVNYKNKKEMVSVIKETKQLRLKNELPIKKRGQKTENERPIKKEKTVGTKRSASNQNKNEVNLKCTKKRKQDKVKNESSLIKSAQKNKPAQSLKKQKSGGTNKTAAHQDRKKIISAVPKERKQLRQKNELQTAQNRKTGQPLINKKMVGTNGAFDCQNKKEIDTVSKETKQSRLKNELPMKKRGQKTENERPIKKEKTVGTKRSSSNQNKNEINLKCIKKRKQDKLKNECPLIKSVQKNKPAQSLKKQKSGGTNKTTTHQDRKKIISTVPKERKQPSQKNELHGSGPKVDNERPMKKETTAGSKRSASCKDKNEIYLICPKKRKQDDVMKNEMCLVKSAQKNKTKKSFEKQKNTGTNKVAAYQSKKEIDSMVSKQMKNSCLKNELPLMKRGIGIKTEIPSIKEKKVGTKGAASNQNKKETHLGPNEKNNDRLKNESIFKKNKTEQEHSLKMLKTVGTNKTATYQDKEEIDFPLSNEEKQSMAENELPVIKKRKVTPVFKSLDVLRDVNWEIETRRSVYKNVNKKKRKCAPKHQSGALKSVTEKKKRKKLV